MCKVYILGMRDTVPDEVKLTRVVNTTSHSANFGKGLSPFFLGPVEIGGRTAKNVENAWQYSKVYRKHLDSNGEPAPAWWDWSECGFRKTRADRYPMGRGAHPEYSYLNGHHLDYIEARKSIYIPIYSTAVRGTEAWEQLVGMYREDKPMALVDFDGYRYDKLGYSLDNVVHDQTRKMGHAFVLAMMLEDLPSY